ncbi:RHS repeat domain-containing protein [Burkholderia gladioli]|uniref:RHS repeat domain-containing protein n=1 Tax=Burkholderia gladioli TaxID=28095 RepID=UPI0038B2BC2F
MKKNHALHGSTGRVVQILITFILLLASLDIHASGDCSSLYASSGAIPGSRTCELTVASRTPGGMANYACINDIEAISAWCAAAVQEPAPPEPEATCPVADPVYPGSGAVTLTASDFVSGDELPMVFTRTYVSNRVANGGGAMGAGWSHNWQRRLDVSKADDGQAARVVAYREDGEPVTFQGAAGQWRTSGFTGLALARNASGWLLTDLHTETVESYSAQGRMLYDETLTRVRRTLSYDASGLLTHVVQHAAGSAEEYWDVTLKLGYDGQRRLSSLTDPLGRVTRYAYDANNNLSSVTWPDNSVYRYVYEDSRFKHALTGEIDEVGARIATWTYDDKGRAVSVNHPDSTRDVQFVYRPGSTTIVGSGQTTTLNMASIGGVLRPTTSTSTAGNASSTWDASGRLVKDIAADGGTSEYRYDEAGRPVSATVTNRSGSSVTSIRYADATSLRPSMIASPNLIQAFTYNSAGATASISETPTTDATGANGFAAPKVPGTVATVYALGYTDMNRLDKVVESNQGNVLRRWYVIRDYGGNAYEIQGANASHFDATSVTQRDAAHRALVGRNPTGEFKIRYDLRGRIDRFTFKQYARFDPKGTQRLFKVAFEFAPNGRVISRTGTVASSNDIYRRDDGPDLPISQEEINQWIDNYNHGDSPIAPQADLLGTGTLAGHGSIPMSPMSTVCHDCHFVAGLPESRARWIGGAARGIAFVWRLLKNPAIRYGIGQGAKKAAEKLERAKAKCKPAATAEVEGIPPGRILSMYFKNTKGRSVRNIETDVPKAEFEANLVNGGWSKGLSKDGKSDIFQKNDLKYVTRDESNAGFPTADYYPAGATQATLKIRFLQP